MEKEYGHYKCVSHHEFDVTDCRLSPFEGKSCPKCGGIAGLEYVYYKVVDYYASDPEAQARVNELNNQ
jgi:hypothetical protein